MNVLKVNPALVHKTRIIQIQSQQIKQMPKIRLANLVNMPENEFAKMIKGIEENPLFKKLMYPENYKEKVIGYRRFPHTDMSQKFYELKEEIVKDSSLPEIELLIAEKKEILNLARKIGEEKFKKYFLYCEDSISLKQIARECNLSISEVKKLMEFVNNISIYNEFYHPSNLSVDSQIHYTKVASINKNSSGKLLINFLSPQYVRGIYKIDYDKLEHLKSSGNFSEEELKQLNELVKNIELINNRKTTLYKVIRQILEKQRAYFNSGDISDLKPYQQKELAKEINIDPSLVCRAINGRSIDTPFGEEKPLKYFFPGEKIKIEILVKNIIQDEKNKLKRKIIIKPYNDEQIKNILERKYKISIARRTVREYRNKLGIPSAMHQR